MTNMSSNLKTTLELNLSGETPFLTLQIWFEDLLKTLFLETLKNYIYNI